MNDRAETIALIGGDNPEKNAIVSDLIWKLSKEAKFVLNAIVNAPDELAQFMFHGIVKKKAVFRKLRDVGLDMSYLPDTAAYLLSESGGGDISEKAIRKYLKYIGWKTSQINVALSSLKRLRADILDI